MTPFFFGSSARRLFGIYDPSRPRIGAPRAAVLCHPAGDEHIHAYRTMRLLADHIAESGLHVLRFDYFATGDSGGACHEADLDCWHDDVLTAMDELKDMTGARRVALVGLRIGANVAARAAAANRDEVESVVLWDPLDSLAEHIDDRTVGGGVRPPQPSRTAVVDVAGPALDLSLYIDRLPERSLMLLTQNASRRHRALETLTVEHRHGMLPWVKERTTTGTVPIDAIQRIVEWLQ